MCKALFFFLMYPPNIPKKNGFFKNIWIIGSCTCFPYQSLQQLLNHYYYQYDNNNNNNSRSSSIVSISIISFCIIINDL